MLDSIPVLSLIVFIPLLGALILQFMPGHNGKWLRIVAMITTLIPLLLSGWLYAAFQSNAEGVQFEEYLKWLDIPLNRELTEFTSYSLQFDYHLAVDGLSLPLVFLTALIAMMALFASVFIKKRWKTFYTLFLLLETGMFGVFLAQDVFLFFLFFEAALVPVFFLIGIWGYQEREKAANRFLIYNGLGSAIMLLGLFILVATVGFTFVPTETGMHVFYSGDLQVMMMNIMDPNAYANLAPQQLGNSNPFYFSESLRWTAFILLIVGFGIKLPLFPFHTWMLKVHTEASPAVVMLHSGILLKMGAYGLIRFGILLFPEQAHSWSLVLTIVGVVNVLYGAILACKQTDFKLVLAYSSISHMGIVLLGIASLHEIGMQGAVYQMVSHGLISALMFLIVGSLYERTGTTTLSELGGLAKSAPFISGILLVCGLASLGLPGLSGFIGEFLALLGLFENRPVLTAIAALGLIFGAVYVLRAVLSITFGPQSDKFAGLKDARLIEAIPMIALVSFIILLGIYPSLLTDPLKHSFDYLFGTAAAEIGG